MKKTLLFVLALIASGCAEPIPRNLDDLPRQGPQYVDRETLEPYSGPAYRMSEDDSTQIVLRVNLRDGRFHGDFEDFELEGDSLGLYETGTYRDGQLEGRFEYFYPSGVLRARGTYDNDELDGPSESYYENGQLQEKSTYVADERDGPYEGYHENGQLREKSNFTAGELDGPSESYYENGQLNLRFTNRADERHGPYERYESDGQLGAKGTYDMGLFCGEWIYGDSEIVTYDPCPPGLADGN